MMTHSFAHLVYEGRIDEAVALAKDLQPEAVSRYLFSDPTRYTQSYDSVRDFIHAWYATLTSTHQRADAALLFRGWLTPEAPSSAENDSLSQHVISASEAWLAREAHESQSAAEAKPHDIARVVGGLLADLVYAGRLDDAINVAKDLHPDAIHRMLFREDLRWLQVEAPGDEFVRAWYSTLESAYLRAEAAYTFSDTFMTELAPVPNGEFIGANMKTEALRQLLETVSRACLGAEVNDWAQSPRQPLPAESAAQWREIGRVLANLDFPPSVPAVAPPEEPVEGPKR
jgi:hypothetical protein